MAVPVVFLSSRKAVDVSLAGGKGAGLARLLKAGFPVPPGFVITTAAFREAIAQASALIHPPDLPGPASRSEVSPGREFDHGPNAPRASVDPAPSHPAHGPAASVSSDRLEAARNVLLGWEMPAPLCQAVLDAYRRLGGPVAVRSSMVGEDSQAGSFAGQLDTVLNVEGEDALLDAVRRVLASAFGDRLWAYLAMTGQPSSGQDHAAPSLAVVIQRMVQAQVSGVAFSVDPVTCRPGVVIEAAPGLGEDLVQGRVCPDRYRFDPRGEVEEVSSVRPGAPLLDEPHVRDLADLVSSIADHLETPLDVEWAFDDRRFHILQARPISSVAGKPVYSRRMVSDMAPGLVKPLVWSTKYAPIVQNVFAPAFEIIAGPTGVDHARLSTMFYSRAYMNVTAFGQLFKKIGLPSNLFYVLSLEDRATRGRPAIRLRMLPVLFRLGRFAWREARVGRRVGAFLEAQHRNLDEFRAVEWTAQSPGSLLGFFRRLKALHADSQRHIVIVSANMLVRSRLLGRMIARCRPGTDPRDVIKGYGRRLGLMPFEEMRNLAHEARGLDRGLLERIAEGNVPDAAEKMSFTEAGKVVVEKFEQFMARYGFLSANGSDFSEVPWIENPALVWRSVARMALEHDDPLAGSSEAHREQTLALVRSGLGPVKRRLFDRLHASTIWFMDRRERLSLLMTEDSYLMRRCLLALGGKLVEQGVIAAPEDIFFLYGEELDRLPDDAAEAASAATKIADRKAELARHAALDPPDTLCGDEPPILEPPSAEGLESLAGIGTSAGLAEGRARIVHDPALTDGRFERTDILVVPFTDIGWTPLLAGIGGIVAEAGGQLSHTSIIAREFGIPAVVSVRNATRLIKDGQRVKVDGSAGRVYLDRD